MARTSATPPGTPWAQRSLFPSSLVHPVSNYTFTGTLPPGYTIEVARIAPAFGQPGGGMQLLVKDEFGDVQTIQRLLHTGVLR